MSASDRWRQQLEAWRIPAAILEAAPESPWGFPAELFRHRADPAKGEVVEDLPTLRRAIEALPRGGSVLDVGCGGGATSLPLVDHAGRVVGVDDQADMLEAFLDATRASGVPARTVLGSWPDVASEVEPADVVVCGHVLYNVADAPPFVEALSRHARRRVVLEITERHPLVWMGDLWERFHGLERPSGPTVEDAVATIRETGPEPLRQERLAGEDHPAGGFERREDAIALVRRRLCLPSTRDREVELALGDRLREHGGLWSAGPARQRLTTLWWDVDPADR